MAITKIGIDYYPREVGMMRDRKFNKARQKYGYITYVIYDALLEMIYSDKGYYLKYDDKSKEEVIWELQDYCKGKYPVEPGVISEVIGMLVACELFSGDHFRQGIITSRRIQETYYRITVDRRKVTVDFNIWMLSLGEMKAISSKSLILQSALNRANIGRTSDEHQTNNEENRANKEENQTNKEQSKGKERRGKVKDSKAKDSKAKDILYNNNIYNNIYNNNILTVDNVDNVDNNVREAYRESFYNILDDTNPDYGLINGWLNIFDSELVCEALRLSKGADKSILYAKGILSNWYKEGIRDYVDYLFKKKEE